ncbi:MAG: hypothetical protein FJ144_19715 [Deltaproteobacteria bacterium]|nr:hypothetical protein [Deltaproteobacteria bacterium]
MRFHRSIRFSTFLTAAATAALLVAPAVRATEEEGAAGSVESSMGRAGDATKSGLEKAGEATGNALDKAIDATGKGIGYVIDKTGQGFKKAGDAMTGKSAEEPPPAADPEDHDEYHWDDSDEHVLGEDTSE